MKAKNYVLGVDIGTTATKSVLFSVTGSVLQQSTLNYPLSSPNPLTAEQNPEEIFIAVLQTIFSVILESQIDPEEIICLSFSSAMHSLIAVDVEGNLLTQSLTWADRRGEKWVNLLKEEGRENELYRLTGIPFHPMSPLIKLVWLRNEYPDLFYRAAKFISIKEYIIFQLFDRYLIDTSLAAATGLLNLHTLTWCEEALNIAGITPDRLSEIVPTTYILPSLNRERAIAVGIPEGIPTVIGSSDGVLANLGVGAIYPKTIAVTIGTSGAVRTVSDRLQLDEKNKLFCYPLIENYWIIGGAVNNGGIVMQWLKENLIELAGVEGYDQLNAIAQTIPAGSEGLIFHPYLTGERAPLWDSHARGSFFGFTLNHTKAHLIRAVLEGIIYNLSIVLLSLEKFTGKSEKIIASGGFTRSPLLRQMLADIVNCPVIIPDRQESSCFGAAILGLYALKKIPTLEIISTTRAKKQQYFPIPENVAIYQKILPIYQNLLDRFQLEWVKLPSSFEP
ncbi:gluconokinase [Spirulina sp. 06S082]|uniref:gluconokinase n=1 Tax=Spirulina sp. 06S082 TaxID=3110248 RepID=UPI002B21532D|nr:FGGY family carbohydrate kinase [Spirulina sp. 06S082]MEA5469302.1 FGGY family carbohydrate kinase [Spirulina sp. 06S082]